MRNYNRAKNRIICTCVRKYVETYRLEGRHKDIFYCFIFKFHTSRFTVILANVSKLPFNVQFYKLLYTHWLATPKRFDTQGIIFKDII